MRAERLQKVLARAGVGSRRQVEELIREGRVTVDGRVAELGDRADLATDAVKVDDRRIRPLVRALRYVLLNKPRGCVSTVSDPEGRPTVLDLVPQRLRPGLNPVGRLDFDTEGLLLLTDDGELAHRVAHPRFGCTKTYEVKVRGRPTEAAIARLRDGITIDGRHTRPAAVSPRIGVKGHRQSVANSWWIVTLGEGRTRQIREMFFRIGHPVQRLRRVAIGVLKDPRLPLGQWRELDEHEVQRLRGACDQSKRPAATKKPPKGRPPKGRTPKARTAKRRRGPGRGSGTRRGPSRRG